MTPLSDLPRKSGPRLIRFEDFEADLRTEELSKSGTRLRLPHQSFCVLAMLLERPGQLVTREELRARLWSGSTLIEYDQRLEVFERSVFESRQLGQTGRELKRDG